MLSVSVLQYKVCFCPVFKYVHSPQQRGKIVALFRQRIVEVPPALEGKILNLTK